MTTILLLLTLFSYDPLGPTRYDPFGPTKKQQCPCGCDCAADECYCHDASRCSDACSCSGDQIVKRVNDSAARENARVDVQVEPMRPVSLLPPPRPVYTPLISPTYYRPNYQPVQPYYYSPPQIPNYFYRPRMFNYSYPQPAYQMRASPLRIRTVNCGPGG